MEPIKISIIIPIYNTIAYLERCVESVMHQTYGNLEIILVDDGSTDSSGALCEKLALYDKRIKVVHQENGGSSRARNKGISLATGDYIGFVDSDDYIEPDTYEILLHMALKEDLEITQISRDEINEDGSLRENVCEPPKEQMIVSPENFMRELLLHRGDCSFCTKLTKATLLKTQQFPEGVLNEDFYLLIHLLPQINGISIAGKQGYHVCYRLGSNTRKTDAEDFSRVFTDIVVNADHAQKLVENYYPELYREGVRFALYQRLDYLLHIPISQMNKENSFYVSVKTYLRKHIRDTLHNPFLTKKNRQYLILLTVAPRTVRKLHRFLKRTLRNG